MLYVLLENDLPSGFCKQIRNQLIDRREHEIMSRQNSSELSFALLMKRILVSLSCVSVTAATNLPATFADEASSVTTAPSWSDGTSSASPVAPVQSEAKTESAAAEKTGARAESAAAEKTEAKTESATAEKTEAKTGSAVAEQAEAKIESAEATEKTEAKTKSVAVEKAEVKTESAVAEQAAVNAESAAAANPESVASEKTEAKIEPLVTEKAEEKAEAAPVGQTSETKSDAVASDKTDKTEKSGAAESEQLASVPMLGSVSTNEPIVVDNDEVIETESTIKYEDLPTDEGKTRVKTGARFPVVISSQITTKTAKKGDPVEARLKYDLKIGDRLIAKKGAVVNGHINYSLPARSTMHSLVSPTRWYRNSGCVGISFDEIINDKGEHLPLVAVPARAARVVKNKGEGRELGINHEGQVTGPWSQQLRYKAIRIGLNAALAPAGAFSFGAMPIALGVIGAANPSFAFMKPVGLNVRHRRIKGFFWGALSGVPGSWLIEDTVVKGQEAVIKPGDEFLAEFQQEFTGEPASEAMMMPNAKSKVHGQVMPDEKKSKGKK
jgi:hypothetical protein